MPLKKTSLSWRERTFGLRSQWKTRITQFWMEAFTKPLCIGLTELYTWSSGASGEDILTAVNTIHPPNRRTSRTQDRKVLRINLSGRVRKIEKGEMKVFRFIYFIYLFDCLFVCLQSKPSFGKIKVLNLYDKTLQPSTQTLCSPASFSSSHTRLSQPPLKCHLHMRVTPLKMCSTVSLVSSQRACLL